MSLQCLYSRPWWPRRSQVWKIHTWQSCNKRGHRWSSMNLRMRGSATWSLALTGHLSGWMKALPFLLSERLQSKYSGSKSCKLKCSRVTSFYKATIKFHWSQRYPHFQTLRSSRLKCNMRRASNSCHILSLRLVLKTSKIFCALTSLKTPSNQYQPPTSPPSLSYPSQALR
jgi:hypothetical protein